MNKIDRLIAAAAKLDKRMTPTVALISNAADGFVLSFGLWDGVPGSGEQRICETFDTLDAARAGYDEFLKRYPAGKDGAVLIDMTGR